MKKFEKEKKWVQISVLTSCPMLKRMTNGELQVKKKDRESGFEFSDSERKFFYFWSKNWRKNSRFRLHFLVFPLQAFEEFHGNRQFVGEGDVHEVSKSWGDENGFLVLHSPPDEDDEGKQEEEDEACENGEIHTHFNDVPRRERRRRQREQSRRIDDHFWSTRFSLFYL